MMYSDDQTGIVIPENHMLMQAMLFGKSYKDAFSITLNQYSICMQEKKQKLQDHFAKKDLAVNPFDSYSLGNILRNLFYN